MDVHYLDFRSVDSRAVVRRRVRTCVHALGSASNEKISCRSLTNHRQNTGSETLALSHQGMPSAHRVLRNNRAKCARRYR